ncbi:MAG: ATP-binding protein, partial [Trueperaceae bacterium]
SANLVRETLGDTPIAVIQGARQVGKSTLAKQLLEELGGEFESLDDAGSLAAAEADPDGFVDRPGGGMLVIDELQRAPGLVRALKAAVDRDRRPGRFLVTGSADLLDVPGVSDSLAGRAETIALYGFSQGELMRVRDDFVGNVLHAPVDWLRSHSSERLRQEYVELVCAGGYPDAVARSERGRERWFSNYLQRIVRRDATEVSRLQYLERLPVMLRLIAANNAGELVQAHLARDSGVPETSLAPYVRLLENLFLVQRVPAWHANLTKRVVARPKVSILDSGLAAHLIGQTPGTLSVVGGQAYVGGLLEGFVSSELTKQRTWSSVRYDLYHFRDRDGAEVDLIAESAAGDVLGIEVKAAKSVTESDFRGLKLIRSKSGSEFKAGIVLHLGERVRSFGDRLWSVPLDAVWAAGPDHA